MGKGYLNISKKVYEYKDYTEYQYSDSVYMVTDESSVSWSLIGTEKPSWVWLKILPAVRYEEIREQILVVSFEVKVDRATTGGIYISSNLVSRPENTKREAYSDTFISIDELRNFGCENNWKKYELSIFLDEETINRGQFPQESEEAYVFWQIFNYSSSIVSIRNFCVQIRGDISDWKGGNTENKKYDVGIVGWWSNLNYGGTLTYYALYKAIEHMGFSVLMIEQKTKLDAIRVGELDNVPRRFARKHYEISKLVSRKYLHELNGVCDRFVSGSDQLFNPCLEAWSGERYYLSFADDDKRKITYGSSFGNEKAFDGKRDYAERYRHLIRRFDAISTREDYAVDLMEKVYGVKAKQVCDPVFLIDVKEYGRLAEVSKIQLPKRYVLNFQLDPDNEKNTITKQIANWLNADVVNFTDLQEVEEKKKAFDFGKTYPEAEIEDFLAAYMNAEFVITDSFHGTCFALIFNKNFLSLANKKRGMQRFESLLRWVNLEERLITTFSDLDKKNWSNPVDYKKVNSIVATSKKDSLEWLANSLNLNQKIELKKDVDEMKTPLKRDLTSNADFVKIRLLATLLRDYGIKHIVLSPGGRDVPLIRMFEYNEDVFTIHRVTDERSAAYFGLGIAAQLRKPVACICTSGTAASNYLPAVTEAFYTGVPLIVITADRRGVYLNHGEDQTIPQKEIYRGVVKKSVSLPEGDGYLEEYQTRRDISDCILETVHNGFGPVHINISIDNISIGSTSTKEEWKLLPFIHPHLQRVGISDGESRLKLWGEELKKSSRILVVYGQNSPLNKEQKSNIERFVFRYNCTIVTDFLSNLDCGYSVAPYNMLQAISQAEFNEKLTPDILITVGGKRLMNDPLTFKVRGGLKNIRHWGVAPDGKVKDFYFRQTSVIEMSQDYFFEWFADYAGDIRNNGVYYNQWKCLTEEYAYSVSARYNAHYIQSKFIPAVPPNSLLHLGVGQSFYDVRRYNLDKTVEVFCNMGTNGIDGCTSTFMGQCTVVKEKLCFLLVGDLSFFYDMNSIWNKQLGKNIRILMVNNNGSGLLRGHNLKGVTAAHNTEAKGWVESTSFTYLSARSKEEFDTKLKYFLSDESQQPLFFEVFCE